MSDGALELEEDKGRAPMPPYVAYSSLNTLFASLKANGMPGRIDRSVLRSFSNQVGTQMITALKFLKLINGDQRPTDKLRELVSAHETPKWGEQLSNVLHGAYPAMFKMNLESASPSEFTETFTEVYGAEGGTLRKCVTFFVAAAQSAKIPISSYILSNRKPRTATAKSRPPKIKKVGGGPAKDELGAADYVADDARFAEIMARVAAKLSDLDVLMKRIFNPTDMNKDEEQAVFTLARYLQLKALKQPNENGGQSND